VEKGLEEIIDECYVGGPGHCSDHSLIASVLTWDYKSWKHAKTHCWLGGTPRVVIIGISSGNLFSS